MLNNTDVLYVFNPILLTNVFAADLRIFLQPEAYSFHFHFCVKGLLRLPKIEFFILKTSMKALPRFKK